MVCILRRDCDRYIPPKHDILAALRAMLQVCWRSADGVDVFTPGVRHVMQLQMDLFRKDRVSGTFFESRASQLTRPVALL